MSTFSALAQLSSHAVDAVMGERLRLLPMTPGRNRAGGPDPDRPVHEVTGVYREIIRRSKVDTSDLAKTFDHSFLTPSKTISIDAGELGDSVLGPGDRIIRIEESGVPTYEITAREFDGRTRVLFTVVDVAV